MKQLFTYVYLFTFLFIWSPSFAQSEGRTDNEHTFNTNIVKINLAAILIGHFSFHYERAVAKKVSAAVGIRFMPKGNLPLKSLVERVSHEEDTCRHFEYVKTGHLALT